MHNIVVEVAGEATFAAEGAVRQGRHVGMTLS